MGVMGLAGLGGGGGLAYGETTAASIGIECSADKVKHPVYIVPYKWYEPFYQYIVAV